MLIRSKILFGENLVGHIEKYNNGYGFTYDSKYLCSESTRPIGLSFPYFKCICLYQDLLQPLDAPESMNNSLVSSNFVMENQNV